MDFLRLTCVVDGADSELAEALLTLCGAVSISLADAADQPLFEPGLGETPVWARVGVHALFPSTLDSAALIGLVESRFGPEAEPQVARVTESDWADAPRQRVRARKIGRRLAILPATPAAASPAAIEVRLHMGLAFGTGRHATTRLCLEWLDAHEPTGCRVLDYGCGSGILAIAALKLGAEHAWATDTDPQALTATLANAELNGVASSLEILPISAIGDTHPDLILANILADTLIGLTEPFAALLPERGQIVMSGILSEQTQSVTDSFSEHFDGFEVAQSGGWVRIAAHRR